MQPINCRLIGYINYNSQELLHMFFPYKVYRKAFEVLVIDRMSGDEKYWRDGRHDAAGRHTATRVNATDCKLHRANG